MSSYGIGAQLRQQRISQGLGLAEVASQTRISERFLAAIEAGEFERLPGLVFTRNFVRQYAITLKLDPQPILAELPKLDESMVQLPNPPARARGVYSGQNSFLSSAVWVLLAIGAGVGGWFYFNHQARPGAVNATRVAATKSAEAPPEVPATATVAENTPAELPATQAEATAAPQPAAEPPAPVAAAQSRPVQVVVTALKASWIQVSADGKASFTGTLQPNERREFPADEQVRIFTGNAGGLSISLNGKTLDPIGPEGQVRTLRLTAEGPQSLPQVRPPTPDPL